MKRLPLLLMVLLAGCASYVPKPLDPAAQARAFDARRLDGPDVRQFVERSLGHEVAPWPPKSWDLTTLTLAALHFQPDLDQARAARLVAEAGIVTAGGRPNPTLRPSVEHSTETGGGKSAWSYGGGLDVPLETAGKRRYRIERARHLAQAAALREAETLWQVRSRVRAALLAAYPTGALLRRQRELQEELAHLLERRFEAGYASRPELTQARLGLSRATLALAENEKRQAEAAARLAAAIGVPAARLDPAALSFDAFDRVVPLAELPPKAMRRQALLGRPDVRAALADYEASQSALQLEIAKQYPDVSLGPGYLWDQGAVKWSLALSVVLPLVNRNQGPIAQAEARRRQAAAALLSVQARAIAEVDEALAGYAPAVRTLETADALLRDEKTRAGAADAAFRAGETDRLAWLSARYETVAAELARIDALAQAQRSLGRLEDALHRPLGGDAMPAEHAGLSKDAHYGDRREN
ncbi:MAG: TolC family protein [Betaproteobacteria bacterium]|nr:TolC family protein [Betaproteobacteria bacterium]